MYNASIWQSVPEVEKAVFWFENELSWGVPPLQYRQLYKDTNKKRIILRKTNLYMNYCVARWLNITNRIRTINHYLCSHSGLFFSNYLLEKLKSEVGSLIFTDLSILLPDFAFMGHLHLFPALGLDRLDHSYSENLIYNINITYDP